MERASGQRENAGQSNLTHGMKLEERHRKLEIPGGKRGCRVFEVQKGENLRPA